MLLVLDAKSAFWLIALDKQSWYLCTFATPWGRNRFLRVPFALGTVPQNFSTKQLTESSKNTSHFHVLVASKTASERATHLRKVLTIASINNLKLNCDKLKFGLPSVTFFGHQLTQEVLAPDPNKVKAIEVMPVPATEISGDGNIPHEIRPKLFNKNSTSSSF